METPSFFKKSFILWDGGLGTMLIKEGLQSGDAPEIWNTEKPEILQQIHKAYYQASSDVVQTNTFGGNRLKLEQKNLGHRTYDLNKAGAENAKAVCPEGKWVCGDMGPTGVFLKPMGPYDSDQLVDAYAEQAKALIEGGVDLIQIETMFSLEEAVCAIQGVRHVDPDFFLFVSFTFNQGPNGYHTMMGESPFQCFERSLKEGVTYVGTNCTLSSTEMVDFVLQLSQQTPVPFMVQANAGQPKVEDGKTHGGDTPEIFARNMEQIYDAGVRIIGGCCGSTPDHIAAIRTMVNQKQNK